MGLIVANMGIQALRSMDPADVGKYVQSLISLALLSVSLRILWVVDMILQVKKAVKKSQEEKGDKNDTIDQDDPNGFNDQPMDSKTVVSFAIQVRFFCFLFVFVSIKRCAMFVSWHYQFICHTLFLNAILFPLLL